MRARRAVGSQHAATCAPAHAFAPIRTHARDTHVIVRRADDELSARNTPESQKAGREDESPRDPREEGGHERCRALAYGREETGATAAAVARALKRVARHHRARTVRRSRRQFDRAARTRSEGAGRGGRRRQGAAVLCFDPWARPACACCGAPRDTGTMRPHPPDAQSAMTPTGGRNRTNCFP